MYNRNYYAQVDDAMMKLWKDFGRRLLHVLDGTMRYVLACKATLKAEEIIAEHNDNTQCWMYVPAHKEYVQAILIVKKGAPLSHKVSEWINRRRKEFGCKKGGLRKNYVAQNR